VHSHRLADCNYTHAPDMIRSVGATGTVIDTNCHPNLSAPVPKGSWLLIGDTLS